MSRERLDLTAPAGRAALVSQAEVKQAQLLPLVRVLAHLQHLLAVLLWTQPDLPANKKKKERKKKKRKKMEDEE